MISETDLLTARRIYDMAFDNYCKLSKPGLTYDVLDQQTAAKNVAEGVMELARIIGKMAGADFASGEPK